MYRIIALFLFPLALFAQEETGRVSRHEVSIVNGFTQIEGNAAQNNNCGFNWWDCQTYDGPDRTQVSTGLTYHYLRPIGKFWLGGGGGVEGMGTGRRERFGLLTGILEYQLGQRRLRGLGRVEAGVNLPIGSDWIPIKNRQLGTIIHPSVGVVLALGKERKQEINLTVGYRFTRTTFDLETEAWQSQEITRKMSYRRLALSVGFRF